MDRRVNNFALPWLALIIASAIWGSSFVALKYTFVSFDPFFVILLRVTLGSVVMLLCWPLLRLHWPSRSQWRWIVVMALCEPCLYFIFEAVALTYTRASEAGMIVALLPLMVAVSARLFLAENVPRQAMIGFVISVSGALLLSITATPEGSAPNPLLGNFLEFLAMVCATGFTLSLRYLSRDFSPLALIAFQVWIGTPFFLVVWLLGGAPLPEQWALAPTLAVVYLGTLVTLGAYGLYAYGVASLSASLAAAFTNLIPIFTLLLGYGLLGERLNGLQLMACAVILIGLGYSQWPSRRLQTSIQEA